MKTSYQRIYDGPIIAWNTRNRRYEREHWRNEFWRIETKIKNFLQKNTNNTSIQLEKRFYDIYENIILNYNYSKKYEALETIKRIYFWKLVLKSLFLWWIIAIWIVNLIVVKQATLVKTTDILYVLNFIMYLWWFLGIFIFLCKIVRKSHYGWLTENSHLIIKAIQDYFHFLKNKESHHRDALFFADLITFLWENIQARTKEIQRLEKKILNNYQYFWKKISIPEEITIFFTKEKKDIQEKSILWQKIIWEWIEIKKNRLQKANIHINNPSIITLNKRRELLLKNFKNL